MKIKALFLVIVFLLTVFVGVFSVADTAIAQDKQTKGSKTRIEEEVLQKIISHYKRGEAFFSIGEYKKAVEDWSKAIDLLSSYEILDDYKAKFHFERGLAYDKVGDLNHAIDDYTRTISLDPNFVMAYNNRAVAYYKIGKYMESIKDCDKYLTFDKKNPEMYYVRGVSKIDWMKDPSGIDDIRTAARMGHKNAQELLRQAGFEW